MFCKFCGGELPEKLASAEFCPFCGKTLTEAEHPALEVSRVDKKPTQAEIIAAAASEQFSRTKQSIAILGASLLLIGVFLPLVSMPLVGSVNYFHNGEGDGPIVLVLAVMSIILALTRRFGGLWITGLCSVGLPLFYLFHLLSGVSQIREQMKTELADNPFRGVADVVTNSVQFQWGWAVLILGGALIVVAAAMRGPAPPPMSKFSRRLGKLVDTLGAVCILMWLLGYFGIVDNWVYRSIPLGTAPRDHNASKQTEVPSATDTRNLLQKSTGESAEPAPAPQGATDIHPFLGALSNYTKYALTDEVSIGQWSYKLIRSAVLHPTVYRPHREFQPEIGGVRRGDTIVAVLAIELLVRNDADVSNRFPALTMISNSASHPDELLEFDQFSGYIDRHLDSSVVFAPGEQLRGVIAFQCCLSRTADSQVLFLRVSGGDQSGKSALISLYSPPPPSSHEPPPEPHCNAPGLACAPSITAEAAGQSFLGFTAGERVSAAVNHAATLGFMRADCTPRQNAPEYSDCKFAANGESLEASFYASRLQRIKYYFGASRYEEILGVITKVHGAPRTLHDAQDPSYEVGEEWGGLKERCKISLGRAADGNGAFATAVFDSP